MGKRFATFSKLSADDDVVRKCEEAVAAIKKVESEKPKVDAELSKMREEVWLLHEAFRKAQVVSSPDLIDIHTRLYNTNEKKRRFENEYFRERDSKHQALQALLDPIKNEAGIIINQMMKTIEDGYILQTVFDKTNPQGRATTGVRVDLDSGKRLKDIFTNAVTIQEAVAKLGTTRIKVREARTIGEIKTSLEALDKDLNKLSFDPVEMTVGEYDFEHADTTKYLNVYGLGKSFKL